MSDFTIIRNGTTVIDYAATVSGAAQNLTGCTILFTAKRSLSDADADAVMSKTVGSGITVDSAAGGTFHVTINPSDTASLTSDTILWYDTKIIDATGNKYPQARGKLFVNLDVTIRTS